MLVPTFRLFMKWILAVDDASRKDSVDSLDATLAAHGYPWTTVQV